jgi:hypothetical protein
MNRLPGFVAETSLKAGGSPEEGKDPLNKAELVLDGSAR